MTTALNPTRMLVGVDFGDASASAVALAGELARAFGTQLTVLHAETLEMPPYFTSAQIDALEAERRAAREAAADYVRRFAALHTPAPVDVVIVDGPPAEAVLRRAPEFDLVVLGTHGRRGPQRWWLGSVAEAVVGGATVPVLVTRARDSTPPPMGAPPLTIAIAGKATTGSERWAELLGRALHARIVYFADIPTLHGTVHPILFVPDDTAPASHRSTSRLSNVRSG